MPGPTHVLREEVLQSGLQVDEQAGIIRGVKILGFTSVNRRRYLREAVAEALPGYEGMRVNLDHVGPADQQLTARRSVKDRIGKLTGTRLAEDGAYADLHYNPAHPYGPAIAWAAKNQPDTLGLSHVAIGQGKPDKDGTFIVNKIVSVRSVDLVADPATTKGLFEDMEPELNPAAAEPEDEGYEASIGKLVCEILKDGELSMDDKKKKILQALKLMDDDEEDEKGSEEEDKDGDDEEEESVDPKKELARLKAEKKARQMCEAAKVSVTEAFIEALAVLKNEKAMKRLIEDRKAVVNKPRSAAPGNKPLTLDEFAAAARR
jgi:hypothetical protein